MAWTTLDRKPPAHDDSPEPLLSEAVKEKIRRFFPRYPTRRAVLLPALHIVQETYGYISHRAMRDIAELLEIAPSQVLDTASFYTHFWTHPKGKKTIVSCRSLSCQLMGANEVNEAISQHLGVEEHGTSADGAYSFVTEECLGACDHAPCLLINEKLHKRVKAADVPKLLADPNNDVLDIPRSDLYEGVHGDAAHARPTGGGAAETPQAGGHPAEAAEDAVIEATSDVQEMKEAD